MAKRKKNGLCVSYRAWHDRALRDCLYIDAEQMGYRYSYFPAGHSLTPGVFESFLVAIGPMRQRLFIAVKLILTTLTSCSRVLSCSWVLLVLRTGVRILTRVRGVGW